MLPSAFAKMKTVNRLVPNQFKGVCPKKEEWYKDDDLGSLLNIWYNPRMKANPHYEPIFAKTNVTMNAGSAILFGDCYREQFAKIFQDARLFAPEKIVVSKRYCQQKPEGFVPVADDLRLFMLVFQSFNSGRLDERREAVEHVFKVLKEAREIAAKAKGGKHP